MMANRQGLFEKALETVDSRGMIQRDDLVAVGVSGGADSVALLDFLRRLSEVIPFRILVCHLNHGLRGEEAERDEAFTRALAEKYGLPFRLRREKTAEYARERRLSAEEAGRELRYAFFEDCAGKDGKIATAHTLSDSMETVLINLCRGTGVKGLRGIPPTRGRIIRPLSACTREEVEEYCRKRSLAFVTDSTNLSPGFSRNRLRLAVIPELMKLNPALPAAFDRLMARMEGQWRMTKELAEEAKKTLLLTDGRMKRQGLLALPTPVREELFLDWLETAGKQSSRLVEEMEETARRGSGEAQLGEEIFFTADEESVGLVTRSAIPDPPPLPDIRLGPETLLELENPLIFPLGGGRTLKITPLPEKKGELPEKINKTALNNAADCGRIKGTVILRRKRAGDRMAPVWRQAGSHPLKKLCQEAEIPRSLRRELVVAEDDRGIVWAEGIGADRRCAWSHETQSGCVWEVLTEATKMQKNEIKKVLITEEELAAKVAELGAQISKDYEGKKLIIIGVLKGSVVFMSDLIRQITIPVEMDFMAVSSYGSGVKTSGVVKILKDLDRLIAGYDVLVVEDILDSGMTLSYLMKLLQKREPASIRIATLLDKPERRMADIRADYVGFSIPDEFVVGYGLDYAELYRNLPYVGILDPSVYGGK